MTNRTRAADGGEGEALRTAADEPAPSSARAPAPSGPARSGSARSGSARSGSARSGPARSGPASRPDAAAGAAHDVPARQWRVATGRRKPWLVRLLRPVGRALFRAAFAVRVEGTASVPRSGAVLLAGNHTGFLDGPLVWAFSPRPATFLAKSELFVGPLARALGWLGQVPVHRGRPDRTALRTALGVLAENGAMGVFPEGTRGAGVLEEVSDGLAWLALRSGAPVVPIAVIGTAEALPKGGRPRLRAPVRLVFGPPATLQTTGDPRVRRTVRAAAEELRLVLQEHLVTQAGGALPRAEETDA